MSTPSRWPSAPQFSPALWQPIIVGLVLGLGATIWVLQQDVTRMSVQINNMRSDVDRLESKLDNLPWARRSAQ